MASRYHLTLLYLGAIASAKTGLLQDLLIHLQTLRLKQFGLSMDRTGHFGSKVAWIGCTNIPPALQDLHAGLVRSTASAGIVTERAGAFVPHVTVARDAGSRWPASGPLQIPIRWPVHDFLLMRSMPSQQFAYRTVARFPLTPAHGD